MPDNPNQDQVNWDDAREAQCYLDKLDPEQYRDALALPRGSSILDQFIAIGRATEEEEKDHLLEAVKNYSFMCYMPFKVPPVIAEALDLDELEALIRGIVMAEIRHNESGGMFCTWSGHSFDSVIFLYREYQCRDSKGARRLGDWILPIRINPYIPFGTRMFLGKSMAEYDCYLKHKNDVANEVYTQQVEAELKRKIRARQSKNAVEARKSGKREKIVSELEGLSIKERLIRIANDPIYPVHFYPVSWAREVTADIAASLPRDIQVALLEKLKGRQKGRWRHLKARLVDCFLPDNPSGYGYFTLWNRESGPGWESTYALANDTDDVGNKYLRFVSFAPILGLIETEEELKGVFEELGLTEFLCDEDGKLTIRPVKPEV
jgi:hypothetical protein